MSAGGEQSDEKAIPNLLTQDEAVKLLRLDELNVQDPKETLRYLRRTRQLGYVKVARKVLIPRAAIRDYLRQHTTNPIDRPSA